MYKSKLQEFCQSKAWDLPKYSTHKEGLAHCPQFKATVIVKGSTFSTPDFCKSSKEAHNFAAKLAFDHLTGSSSANSSSPPVRSACSDTDAQQNKTKETECVASLSGMNSPNRGHKKFRDVSHLYKNQLQTYAQKRNILLPMYFCEREGPPHACRFKSKVALDGKTYESPEYFSTVKDAENAAAKVALMAVSSDGVEEEDSSFYKNLLQELAQIEYSCLPAYNTTCFGTSHPNFISTVEIRDKSFIGREAKTKKLAEMDAAKIAYISLKDDVSHLYKNQLQTYAQKRNILLPMYFCERDGPPHACRFKSKVTLDGKTYESPEYFSTIKDAESAAAKVALMAVSSDGVEEEDPSFYKNLLQELAQIEYSCLPAYNTTSFGTSHPDFISTVEISDKSFVGREAKTKELAEMDAAKVAYISLKDYLQKQNTLPYSPGSHVEDSPHCSSPNEKSIVMAELSQQIIPESALRSSETSTELARGAYRKIESEPIEVEMESKVIAVAGGDKCKPNSPNSPSASVQYPSRSGIQANTEQPAGIGSFPSYKVVKIYPQTPDMTFPPGTTIMYDDEKWVAVTNSDSIQDNA